MSVGSAGSAGGSGASSGGELDGVVGALVDQNLVGLICLDRGGAIIESNALGRELLSRDGGLREGNRRLGTHRPADASALERLLKSALDGVAGKRPTGGSTVIGAWPDQRPLTVHVNPVVYAPGRERDVAALVVTVDPWPKIRVRPEQVAISLGLTPAESRVAASLAEGKTVAEIARTTKRAPQSIRWLVKQALAKTWCSRQADLVRLVLSTVRLPIPQSGK